MPNGSPSSKRITREQIKYQAAHEVSMTLSDIDSMGQKTITGKIAGLLPAYLACKGGHYQPEQDSQSERERPLLPPAVFQGFIGVGESTERYDSLKEKCPPFLDAMEHFPDLVRAFVSKVRELFSVKEAQEWKEKKKGERRGRPSVKRENRRTGSRVGRGSRFDYTPNFLTSSPVLN